ncbi:MAG: trigger factor [Trueperaceae bacterium]|nr:trigger factor [Trueperaceae bacterium]
METVLKDKQPVKATLGVTIDASQVDATFDQVLDRYARQVKVPGFRPGKVPRGVLIRKIGEDALRQEVREVLIDEVYPEAVREHDLAPVHAHVHGEEPIRGEAYEFELHLDLYPEFSLPDLSEIVLDTEAEPVTDAQIDETVENLRREHATLVPVDRKAEPGDQVLITTLDENDEPREEGNVMPLDLERVGDELAEQLVGHGIGETLTLTVEDPSQRDQEGAEGTSTMRVRIEDVKEKDKPDADDAFAATLGLESWSEVLDAIRGSLERETQERADEQRREEFVDKLMEQADPPLPDHLVRRRQGQLLEELADDLRQKGMELDAYLQRLEADDKREEFDAELKSSAEKGVRRDLVLEKLLEERPAEVSDAEFDEAVRQMAARAGKDAETFRRERGDTWLRNYRFLLRRDKALRAAVAERAETSSPSASDEAGTTPGSDTPPDDAEANPAE